MTIEALIRSPAWARWLAPTPYEALCWALSLGLSGTLAGLVEVAERGGVL